MSTSHGNVITGVGTCPVCGRENVALKDTERVRGLGVWQTCADEHGCFKAWQLRKPSHA